jgi:hypothetical protein
VNDAESARIVGAQAIEVLGVAHALVGGHVDEVGGPEASLGEPLGREERRPDRRAPGAVRIGFGGDRRALAAHPIDETEDPVHVAQRGAVHVAVVHVGARLGGGAHELLGAVHARGGREGDEIPHMREGRHAARRGETRHAQVFRGARPRRVTHQHADAEAAPRQLGLQEADDAVLLGGGGFPLPRGVREVREHGGRAPIAAVPGEHLDPRGRPGRGVTEVQGPALRGRPGIRLRHRDRARFELERGGDAVEGLEPVPAHALRVAVQVDEAGRDHTALGREHGAPA